MNASTWLGFALVLAAGVMNGSFAVPMKWTRNWAWENIWIAWSFVALFIFPLLLTTATIPRVPDLYRSSDPLILFWVCAAGTAWGASQVLFGLGIKRAGMALGFAIVVGLAAATGSLIPLLQLQTNQRGESAWHGVVLGITIIVVGICLCSYAGGIKDRAERASGGRSSTGIMLCIAAGLGGSMINIGMVAGARLAANAWGLATGEWRQTAVRPRWFMLAGVCCLISWAGAREFVTTSSDSSVPGSPPAVFPSDL